MTDELRAACERLRRYQAASDANDVAAMDAVYDAHGNNPDNCDSIWEDQADVADAYLAEHPADDDEPITEDWLAANRFQDRGELMGYSILLPPSNACAIASSSESASKSSSINPSVRTVYSLVFVAVISNSPFPRERSSARHI